MVVDRRGRTLPSHARGVRGEPLDTDQQHAQDERAQLDLACHVAFHFRGRVPCEGEHPAACFGLRIGVYTCGQVFSEGGLDQVRNGLKIPPRVLEKERPLALPNQLAALLVASDPRGAADRTLSFLATLNKARGAAVFAADGEHLTLFTGRGVDVEAVAAVQAAWASHRDKLRDGQVLRDSDARASYALAPLLNEGSIVALLYLEADSGSEWSALDTSSLTAFGVAIAQAVIAAASAPPQPSPVQAYLSQTSDEEIARERLLLLLVQNEWNISRVARLMGVTRRTIYLRLQRHNIVREKVRKTEIPSRKKAWSPV